MYQTGSELHALNELCTKPAGGSMSDELETKLLRRLMARDAVVWASRNGAGPPKGREVSEVLAEWQAEGKRALIFGSSQAA